MAFFLIPIGEVHVNVRVVSIGECKAKLHNI